MMRIAMLGATRGCGLEALVYLAQHKGAPVEIYALARNIGSFSQTLEDRLQSNTDQLSKITIIQGDALSRESLNDFFEQCSQSGPIHHVLSSIGAFPVYSIKEPLTLKFAPGMENVCSRAMENTLTALKGLAKKQLDGKAPNLYVVSSNGIGKSTHDALPLLLRPLYGRLLKYPHEDKHAMETMLHKTYNISSPDFNDIDTSNQPKEDSVFDRNRLMIVRPSLLADGKATESIRSSETILRSAWTISRKDVGVYLAKRILSNDQSDGMRWQGGIVLSN